MADYGMWQGISSGLKDLNATGMNLLQFNAQQQHQKALELDSAARLRIAEQQADQQKKAFDYEQKKRTQAEQMANAFTPVDLVAPGLKEMPSLLKQYTDAVQSAGIEVRTMGDGSIHVQNRGLELIQKLRGANTAFKEAETKNTIADLESRGTSIAGKIAELVGAGKGEDDKNLMALRGQQKALQLQMSEMLTMDREFMEKKALVEAKPTQQDTVPYMTPDGKTVLINERDPRSQVVINQQGLIPVSAYQKNKELDIKASERLERMAQTKQFHDENLAFRQTLMDMNKDIRTRLPAAKAQELGGKTQTLSRYAKLADDFKDNFGGSVVGGPTMTEVYSRTGAKQERVNWWKSFKMLDVQLRHDLFGATLTANEQKAWDAVTVSENTDPEIIKTAIKTRAGIAKEAMEREIDSYGTAGYNVSKFGYQAGPTVGDVVDGYKFKGGDPSKRENWEK